MNESINTNQKDTVFKSGSANTRSESVSLPMFRDLDPTLYDAYSGKASLPSRTSHVPITYEVRPGEIQKAVINLVDIWIDPEMSNPSTRNDTLKTEEAYVPTRPKVTMLYIGGGDSAALSSTGQAGYIRDAQIELRKDTSGNNSPEWDIANIITISHPSGSERSEKILDRENMKTSAEIIYQAIKQALKDGNIKFQDHFIIMGASAGGAVAIELAALMKNDPDLSTIRPEQIILSEPAGISEQPKIMRNFMLSGIRAALERAKQQKLGIVDTIKALRSEVLVSMTQPEGAPQSVRQLIRSVLSPTDGNFVKLSKVFGIENPAKMSGLNAQPLMHDTTEQARQEIDCPVTMIESLQSEVVNPWQGHNLFTASELLNMKANDSRIVRSSRELMKKLFPKSPDTELIAVDGFDHSGLGRNPDVWKNILSRAQRIPMPKRV